MTGVKKIKRPRTTLRDLSKPQKKALKRLANNRKPKTNMNIEILSAIDFWLDHQLKENLAKAK